jgi:hypothetical protein
LKMAKALKLLKVLNFQVTENKGFFAAENRRPIMRRR